MGKEIIVTEDGDMFSLLTPYNSNFIKDRKKKIGRREWDPEKKVWRFPIGALPAVRELLMEHYGFTDEDDCSETLTVVVKTNSEIEKVRSDISVMGKTVCYAKGRDSGGFPGRDVYYIKGEPASGGSVKSWKSVVPEGCLIRLCNVSPALYEQYIRYPEYTSDRLEVVKVEKEEG